MFIGKLDGETKVYCGHEYTAANFAYAMSVEPENETLLSKKSWVRYHKFWIRNDDV